LTLDNVTIYPNPYIAAAGNFKVRFDVTGQANKITIRIYTTASRKVIETTEQGSYARDTVITLPQRAFGRLANGVYYVVITAQNGSERAVSKPEELLVLR
jgi:hypothetical protein